MSDPCKRRTFEVALVYEINRAPKADILKLFFERFGIPPDEIIESTHGPFGAVSFFTRYPSRALRFHRELKVLKLKNIQVKYKTLFDRNWKTKWKEEFRPFALTPSLDVIPLWLRKKDQKNGTLKGLKGQPIYLDSTSAFGTGLHATTKSMANLIERSRGKFNTFLDVGTGTGLLSIVAIKNNAKEATAIDIDPEAVKTARSNFKANECCGVKIRRSDAHSFKKARSFDLVAANLISQDLVKLKKKLISLVNRGKYLAVSGIALSHLAWFKEHFHDPSLHCLKISKGDGWAALLYKKNR